jgi:hypothetical protein
MSAPWPWLRATLGAALVTLVVPSTGAHEFKLDALMNAFVKIDSAEAHLLIRVPIYLFKSVRFPVKGVEIDAAKSGDALERAVAALQRDVTIFEDGRPLTAAKSVARLALPSDRSFESYAEAEHHVAEPLPADTGIVIDQGYVDAHLTYPIRSPDSVFTVRTTAGPELGDYLKMAIRYLSLNDDARAMVITSQSGAVALNPSRFGTMIGFIKLGIVHILTGFDHLLFLLCLVIPLVQRRHRAGPDCGALRDDSGARARAALCADRTGGDDHSLGDRRTHRLALDERALGCADESSMAEPRLGRRRCGRTLDRSAADRRRCHRLCCAKIAFGRDQRASGRRRRLTRLRASTCGAFCGPLSNSCQLCRCSPDTRFARFVNRNATIQIRP